MNNLLVTLECWTSILEDGSGLDVIYLDFQKAFDTVPQTVAEVEGTGIG